MNKEFDELFNRTVVFKDCELLEYQEGLVRISTIVNASNTNPYGKAHGGYLYTLCDSLAGLLCYSMGSYAVTLQASINYMKEAKENDVLYLEGKAVHNGRTTKVVDVEVHNQDEKLLCKATFTMYVIATADEQ